VIRDLCTVARAEGHTTDDERAELCRIATALNIPALFVDCSLDTDPELD
jgi:hypothetical protein